MKKIIVTDQAPSPVGPYSQAVFVNGMLYCSGQIALDAVTGELVTGSIEEETKKVMENVGAVLQANNMGFANVIKTTIFLASMDDFARVNEVYASYFTADPPARSCVEVSRLPKGVQVEVEVLAAI